MGQDEHVEPNTDAPRDAPADRPPARRSRSLRTALSGSGLRARALRSSSWTIVGYGIQQSLRLGSTLILTRLLFPDAYGLMALAMVFMTGIQMFSDLGIRPAIIHNKRGHEDDFLDTAWTIQVIRGFALWAIACLLAYPVSLAYEEPSLFPILCVIGVTAAIRGFQPTSFATANKVLALGRLTCVEVVAQMVAIVGTIAWAAYFPSVWALVGGAILSGFASVTLGFRWLPRRRHRFRWDRTAVDELIRFGKWVFLSTIVTFIAKNGDRLMLGKFMDKGELGLYHTALQLAILPQMLRGKLAEKVLLAVYAAHQDSPNDVLRRHVVRMRLAICGLLLPMVAIFVVFGQEIIDLLYDERYTGAGWILQVLAAGFGMFIATNIGPFYLGQGRSSVFMVYTSILTAVTVVAMAVGAWVAGAVGIVFGVAAANLAFYPFQAIIYHRYRLWLWSWDLLFGGFVLVVSGIAVARSWP